MRTPEEVQKEVGGLIAQLARHDLHLVDAAILIQQKLDELDKVATAHGMTLAAEIAGNAGCTNAGCNGDDFHGKRCPSGIYDNIIEARDNLLKGDK